MYLTVLDLILVLIIFSFIAFGFVLGLVQAVGGLIGLFIGAWVATAYYEPVGDWLSQFAWGQLFVTKTIAFIIIFTVINRLVGLIFFIINKIFKIVSIIPFTKSLNRALGAVFGLLEGVMATGLVLAFMTQLGISQWFIHIVEGSLVARGLLFVVQVIAPLLPGLFHQLNVLI